MIAKEPMLVAHARSELDRAGLFDKDSDYDGMLGEAILELIEVFAEQGHSGTSACAAIDIINTLLKFNPLTPLTYAEDEWDNVSDATGEPMWQNKRKPDVFSRDHGVTWYCLDGAYGVREETHD